MTFLLRKTHSVCPSAVRKNRYVILPVDFEEAWKVSCLDLFAISHVLTFFSHHSKQSNGQTKHTSSVSLKSLESSYLTIVTLSRSVVWLLLVR